jgi:hypothetical protein
VFDRFNSMSNFLVYRCNSAVMLIKYVPELPISELLLPSRRCTGVSDGDLNFPV